MDWARRRTDAPPDYHAFVAVAILGAACGNRVTIDAYVRAHPNQWVMLVGPTGMRKSTCTGYGTRILEEAVPDICYPHNTSVEALLEVMIDQPGGIWSISELGTLMQLTNKEWNSGLKETMLDLYDSKTTRIARKKRATKEGEGARGVSLASVRDPALTIMAGTTREWLESSIKETDLEGGFMGRWLFCHRQERGPHVSLRERKKADPGNIVRDSLVKHLHIVSQTGGVVDTSAIDDELEGWSGAYGQRDQSNNRMAGIFNRADMGALKLASIFTLSENPTSLKITPEAWGRAVRVWDAHEASAKYLFGSGLAFTKTGKLKRNIREFVRKNKAASRSQILRHLTDHTARDIEEAISGLVGAGALAVEKRKGARGPSASWYVIAEKQEGG